MNVSGYKIEKQIGRGGMAMVYLAVQESLGRPVALKIMNPMFSDTREFTERFINEGRILASLNHRHIITIHDIGVCNGLHFISMEFAGGGDLGDKIKQGISAETAIEYTQDIAGSLQVAHAAHIVHRDLKPANILFRGDDTLLLTDFGIAKQLASAKGLTATGSLLGSPHYLSPEQAQGIAVDARADIYSLGIMLYEMLLGARPYEGNSDVDIAIKHITQELTRLPDEFAVYQNLLDCMAARNPDRRFPSAGSLLEALREFRATGAWCGKMAEIRDATIPPPIETDDTGTSLFIKQSETDLPSDEPGDTVKLAVDEGANTIPGTPETETNPDGRMAVPAEATRPAATGRLAAAAGMILLLVGVGIFFYSWQREDTDHQEPKTQEPKTRAETGISSQQQDDAETKRLRHIRRQISELLRKAETALENNHLTNPIDDNAFDYYKQVLILDRENTQANLGFGKIADQYLGLAIGAERDWDYDRASIYVERGLTVKPDHDDLLQKQHELEAVRGDVGTKTKNALKGVKKLFD